MEFGEPMKPPFPLLHGVHGSDISLTQRSGAIDLIYWQIHPCSDSDLLPSQLPFKAVHSLEKRGQKPPSSGQKQPRNCSSKGSAHNFRIQATLRVFFLAWLRVPRNTMAQSHLQIRVIQAHRSAPQEHRPRGMSAAEGFIQCCPLQCLSLIYQPHLRSPALCLVLTFSLSPL